MSAALAKQFTIIDESKPNMRGWRKCDMDMTTTKYFIKPFQDRACHTQCIIKKLIFDHLTIRVNFWWTTCIQIWFLLNGLLQFRIRNVLNDLKRLHSTVIFQFLWPLFTIFTILTKDCTFIFDVWRPAHVWVFKGEF